MPQIDDGSTNAPASRSLTTAWVTLSVDEARDLLASLQVWAEEAAEGRSDAGWHTHITDADGNELTLAVSTDTER